MIPAQANPAFMTELTQLLNRHSVDSQLNTPDFILAQHLTAYLNTLRVTMFSRDAWFTPPDPRGPAPQPMKETADG